MKTNETHDAIIIEIEGNLKDDSALKLGKEITKLEQTTNKDIVLDVSRIKDVDSRGLGTLVYLWKTMDNDKHSLVLLNPSEFLEKILIDTNLIKVFSIIKDIKDLKRL